MPLEPVTTEAAKVAVTVVLFAVTATVPNIFLVGSENGDLLKRTAVAPDIAPVTGSLLTTAAVLDEIDSITKNITASLPILIDKKLDLFSSTVNNKWVLNAE